MFLLLVIVLVVAYYAYYFNGYRYFIPTETRIPFPFIGHAPKFIDPKGILHVYKHFKNYNGIYWLIIGTRPIIVVSHEKFIEKTVSSMDLLRKSDFYKPLKPWLNNGLLISSGELWSKRRKLITPTFHFKILESYIKEFNAVSDILLEELEREVNNGSFDICPYISRYTLDVICETAMGTSVNTQKNKYSEYEYAVRTLCKIVIDRAFNPLLMFDSFFKLSKKYEEQKKCLKILHDYTIAVIKRRRLKLSENRYKIDRNEFGQKQKVAFLDLLLSSTIDGRPLTDEEIREEVDAFMFEGHDTTASAISFAIYLLSEHSQVQRKILTEQQKLFGNNTNTQFTYNDLQSMKYLEQVIKEVLRLYPSVPFFGKKVDQNIKIADGTILKKGCELVIVVYGLHRNPDNFPDPEKFDPERFSDKNIVKNPYAYIPFSAGARNCIGQKFAMLEVKATIAKIVRRYEILPAVPRHECILVPQTTLKSANGVRIQLSLRNDGTSNLTPYLTKPALLKE